MVFCIKKTNIYVKHNIYKYLLFKKFKNKTNQIVFIKISEKKSSCQTFTLSS